MRRFQCFRPFSLFLLLFCVSSVNNANGANETLKIGGTGSALGGMNLLAEAFKVQNPDVNVIVLPSLGSGGGIKALKAGAIDLALSARPLKEKEKTPEINAIPYSSTAVVFAGTLKIATQNLSTQRVLDIYSTGNSAPLNGQRVRLVLRPEKETDNTLLLKYIPGMDKALLKARSIPGIPIAITDQDTATELESLKNSLGTIALSLIRSEKRSVTVFSLNGVPPNPETIRSGAYPMMKTFYLVTKSDISPIAGHFIAFLKSAEGLRILNGNGHVSHFGEMLR